MSTAIMRGNTMTGERKLPEKIQYFSGGLSIIIIADTATIHVPYTPHQKSTVAALTEVISMYNAAGSVKAKAMFYDDFTMLLNDLLGR